MAAERYRGVRVLVTGHTGFKGAWLVAWLLAEGADVMGLALAPESGRPSLFEDLDLAGRAASHFIDIREARAVQEAVAAFQPQIVFHLAAQALVRRSYVDPLETFAVNVMGTAHVLEAARRTDSVRAVVCVTSDKCYDNREWDWGYRENEPMGGHDPYSSSKGAAEIVTAAYRRSFFGDPAGARLASARAGNVIGGGDWGEDRLVPDVMRAVLAGESVRVRNPNAIRPWQHVINPLSGYLVLCQAVWEDPELASGWNFGPADEEAQPVGHLVERLAELWPERVTWVVDDGPHPHEAHYLKLDSSRARAHLGWRPLAPLEQGLAATADWYRSYESGADMREVTLAQLSELVGAA
jgi:CDP-glucose 4,6-dehydratase